ncbi:hypothetical protein BDV95DRAFT_481496 [Massariosphaeria phaeospora]|uniref:Uncharacterized protein n=1 Tax=Massariosphaeria phaeospora TaxID=100035 RepID=A0A7C8MJV3_9PLEO|nr:hypothetical protein BDV95DRAFT_481496 [Massariosphaeria phaeospora]
MKPGEKRYHNYIFVETQRDRSGDKIHITGNITDGYRYEKVTCGIPELDESFESREFVGAVRISDYPAMEAICRQQPVPMRPQQKWRGGGLTGGWERCKEGGSFFGEGEDVPLLFRCTEWTEDYTMPALQRSGLLQEDINAQS